MPCARVTFPNTHMECGLSIAQGFSRPAVCGVWVGGGSASAVVDVCVATQMRGLVPHDRVCEMRSGAVLWRRAWPLGLLRVFSRVAARVVAPVRSPRRAVGG